MNERAIHPTAVVAPSARLGAGTRIGPFAVIEDDVQIGDDCEIAAHAVLKSGVRMGSRNRVFEAAVLGGTPQDLAFGGAESELRIGDDNLIREGATLHRATRPGGSTRVGDGNYLMAYVHIAHDCVLGDRTVIANNVCLAGHVRIDDQAFISGGVVIHQYVRVGRLSMIGGNAKVIKDVLPFFLADGVPARTRGLNLVGLRRAGVSASELSPIKSGYRILLSDIGLLAERLERLRRLDSEMAIELAEFVESSKRGYCPAAD